MLRQLLRPISVDEYWKDREFAASFDELTPGEDFTVRRGLTVVEGLKAYSARAIGLAMEHDARIISVDPFRGLFDIRISFVTAEGELDGETHYPVNTEGLICKWRRPNVERGYFLKQIDLSATEDMLPAER